MLQSKIVVLSHAGSARARAVPKKERGNGVWKTRKWELESEEMVFLVTCVFERPCGSLYSEKLQLSRMLQSHPTMLNWEMENGVRNKEMVSLCRL